MARSYRKPILTDGYGCKFRKYAKRCANRAVRRYSDLADGKAYRRLYDSWNIKDYIWFLTPEDDYYGGYFGYRWIKKVYSGDYTKAKRK